MLAAGEAGEAPILSTCVSDTVFTRYILDKTGPIGKGFGPIDSFPPLCGQMMV